MTKESRIRPITSKLQMLSCGEKRKWPERCVLTRPQSQTHQYNPIFRQTGFDQSFNPT